MTQKISKISRKFCKIWEKLLDFDENCVKISGFVQTKFSRENKSKITKFLQKIIEKINNKTWFIFRRRLYEYFLVFHFMKWEKGFEKCMFFFKKKCIIKIEIAWIVLLWEGGGRERLANEFNERLHSTKTIQVFEFHVLFEPWNNDKFNVSTKHQNYVKFKKFSLNIIKFVKIFKNSVWNWYFGKNLNMLRKLFKNNVNCN